MFSGLRSVWTRLRRCKNETLLSSCCAKLQMCEGGKGLNLVDVDEVRRCQSTLISHSHGREHSLVVLEEVKDGLAQQLRDDADVVAI